MKQSHGIGLLITIFVIRITESRPPLSERLAIEQTCWSVINTIQIYLSVKILGWASEKPALPSRPESNMLNTDYERDRNYDAEGFRAGECRGKVLISSGKQTVILEP